jgi:hypothetical protein
MMSRCFINNETEPTTDNEIASFIFLFPFVTWSEFQFESQQKETNEKTPWFYRSVIMIQIKVFS